MTHSENHQPSGVRPLCYDANEIAELLGVSVRSVDRLRESGALTYRRVGHQIRFTTQDLVEFLDRIRVAADS
jgi:excisionase family DNA binding protein